MREQQPIDAVMWVDPNTLSPNDYNPNHVAPPELELLRLSLLSDGWTCPIVIDSQDRIVDGYHRWQLAVSDPDVLALGDGAVPAVEISSANAKASTVRHNRARGTHYVVAMANIVQDMLADGADVATICRELGMEAEEVDRLKDRGAMVKRRAVDTLSPAWKPSASKTSRNKDHEQEMRPK